MDTLNYNYISSYDVPLKTRLFTRILGVTNPTLIKLESSEEPIIFPQRVGKSKHTHLRQKVYHIPDVLAMHKYLKKEPLLKNKGTVIAIWNNKGGVGKSTAAQHLSAIYSTLMGLKTLLIDTDSQADLTMLMGAAQDFSTEDLGEDIELQPTLRDVIGWEESDQKGGWIKRKVDVRDAIIKLSPTLDIIPSDTDVGDLDTDLFVNEYKEEDKDPETNQYLTRFNQVHKAIAPIHDEYDLIIIDCGPNTGLLNLNNLWAADILVIPVEIEAKCLHSLLRISQRLQTYAQLHRGFNFDSVVAVPNKFKNEKLKERALGRLRERYGSILSNTTLKLSASIDKCADAKEPIFNHVMNSGRNQRAIAIAEDFWNVSHEIIGLATPNTLFTTGDNS
jgi:chromosome partitioning protein